MPRVARIVIPGMPHHVTQRGNNRQDVFFVDDDWITNFRLSTHTGRPLATDRLLARLETRLGRRLRPLPVGRRGRKI
jgi:hypothetical protein